MIESFEGVIAASRRLVRGKELWFADVVVDGDVWQLCVPHEVPLGALCAFEAYPTVSRYTRRGLRSLQCVSVREIGRGEIPVIPEVSIVCKDWVLGKCTGCDQRHSFRNQGEEAWAEAARAAQQKMDAENATGDPYTTKTRHAGRHNEFAKWLVDNGFDGPIIDVGGGRGGLAWQLQCEYGIECLTIDPCVAKPLCKRRRNILRKRGIDAPRRLTSTLQDASHLIQTCSALVGLHPDEVTEPIVDYALKYGKPFAVVPCCVFAHLFDRPQVSSYHKFCEYLANKDPSIRVDFLPVDGKNKVIYRNVEAAPRPHWILAQANDPRHQPASLKLRGPPRRDDDSTTDVDATHGQT